MFKSILYDFDGTLADTLGNTAHSYDVALRKFNINLSEKEIVKTCFGKTEKEICKELNISSVEQFTAYYFEGASHFENIKLFPFVKETLQKNKGRGLKLGIVTFAQSWYIEKMLNQLQIQTYFDLVLSIDDVEHPKPAPDAVIKAAKTFKLDVSEIMNIGDAKSDIVMGKSAGSTTVLFLPEAHTRFYNFKELKATNPDYIIKSHQELETILSLQS